jgi:chemotaxis protein CheX
MNVEYINPFIAAARSVIESVLGAKPGVGAPSVSHSSETCQECNVIFGVTGHVQGQVVFGMSTATAQKIAAKMLGQESCAFDTLAASAIGELGNMISGSALQQLYAKGLVCDITPPTMIRGTNVNIDVMTIPAVAVPLNTEQGPFNITIALQARK